MAGAGRIILVYPRHTHGWEAQPWVDMPMGLLSIASPLDRAGYEVVILDQRVEPDWQARLQEELDRDPVCVGVSTSTGPQLRYALEVSIWIKQRSPVPVVWGGVHASLLPEETLRNPCVDYVVQGEGEQTFSDLVRAVRSGDSPRTVPGVWFRANGKAQSSGPRDHIDLDTLPPLSYHLLPLDRYRRTIFDTERLSFFTSRGCPHGCTFCFNPRFNRRRWRAMSASVAVERLTDFAENFGLGGVVFYDSNFFADLERGREILRRLLDAARPIAVTRIHTRADTLTRMGDEDFDLLVRAGCKCLSIGIESGSEKIQNLLGKKIDLPAVFEKNRQLSRFPLTPLYMFMIGVPTETRVDLAQTVEAATRLRSDNPQTDISFNTYTPFPGTQLFDLAVEQGLSVPRRTEEWVGFNYRNLAQGAPWLSKEVRKTVRVLDFCGLFLGKKYVHPYKETKTLPALLAKLYAPIARWRARTLCVRFPVEIWLARKLRLYGKQD